MTVAAKPIKEAFALGVFDELVAPEDVLPRALEAAERLAKLPSGPYAAAKAQLRGALPDAGADPLLERWL